MYLHELKRRVKSLGFEDDNTMNEQNYKEIFLDSLNHALMEIAQTVIGFHVTVNTNKETSNKTIEKIDLRIFPNLSDREVFGVDELIYSSDDTVNSEPYFSYDEPFLYVSGHDYGNMTIKVNVRPNVVKDTDYLSEELKLDINKHVESLLEYLVAGRMWLDDEERKAQMYFNMYDDMKIQLLEKLKNNGKSTYSTVFSI